MTSKNHLMKLAAKFDLESLHLFRKPLQNNLWFCALYFKQENCHTFNLVLKNYWFVTSVETSLAYTSTWWTWREDPVAFRFRPSGAFWTIMITCFKSFIVWNKVGVRSQRTQRTKSKKWPILSITLCKARCSLIIGAGDGSTNWC